MDIKKVVHGLKQSGKIAYDELKQHLLPHANVPSKHTPRLWRHATSNLRFALIVDNFSAKHTSIAQVKHIIHALQQKHEIIVDYTGTLYASVFLDWDYVHRTVKLHMIECIKKVLIKHAYPTPTSDYHAPDKQNLSSVDRISLLLPVTTLNT